MASQIGLLGGRGARRPYTSNGSRAPIDSDFIDSDAISADLQARADRISRGVSADESTKNLTQFLIALGAAGTFSGGFTENPFAGGEGGGFFKENFGSFDSPQAAQNSVGNIQNVQGLLGGGQQPQYNNNAAIQAQQREAQKRASLLNRRR